MNKEDVYKLTTKDAITVLQNLKDWLYFSSMNGGAAIPSEAIDIAIRALEQPKADVYNKGCEGCQWETNKSDSYYPCSKCCNSYKNRYECKR